MVNFHIELKQRSPEWYAAKLGKLGASLVKNILDVKKKMQLKSPDVVLNMVARLVAEIETGFSCDSDFTSESMDWGIDNEDEAKGIIKSKTTGCFEAGGVTNTDFKYFWLSPDLLSSDTGFEIKCLDSKSFAKIVIKDKIPSENLPQLLSYFVVIPDLKNVDFVLYDPRFKKKKLHVIKLHRDEYEFHIRNMSESLRLFDKLVYESLKLFN